MTSIPIAKKSSGWVVPSFGSFPSDDNSDTKNPKKRLRTVVAPPTNKLTCNTTNYSGKPTVNNHLWVDKYSPTTQDQLAVQKKKIEEIKSFLQDSFESKSPNHILLLTGPAGAGKSATIRALARDQKFQIVEWLNKSGAPKLYGTNIFDESQITTFRDFILKSNRYSSSQLFEPELPSKKIILIEEFPTAFFKEPTQFHDVVRKFRKIGTCPLVMIITDNTKSNSNESSLLTVAFKAEVEITGISFNPVAPTSMTKALTRVADAEGIDLPSSTVTQLTDSTSGDIRAAVNALQFRFYKDALIQSVNSGRQDRNRTREKRSNKKANNCEPTVSPFASRDQSLYLFHALGRILHCKRNLSDEISNSLPAVLKENERCPLLVDPEDTWEKTSATAERFSEFLHENYLSFFVTLEDATRASSYLSHADALTSEWEGKSTLEPYVASIVSRGIMHSNTKQTSSGWKPLTKPKMFEINRTYKANCDQGRQMFQDRYSHLTTDELLTQLTPFMLLLQPSCLTRDQALYLQNVTKMSVSKQYSRHHFESLNEKDACYWSSEDDEPVVPTIPQLTVNVKNSDLDLEIEEYDD